MLLIVAVVALKVAEVAVAATVTEDGTVRVELLFDRVTLAPPFRAACDRVTVQVLDPFHRRLVGLHTSDDMTAVVTRLTLAVAELLL